MDNQLSFFDLSDRYAQLSKKGDPLERLDEVIDWSEFDDILAYVKKKGRETRERHSNAGRKPFSSTGCWKKPATGRRAAPSWTHPS